MNQTIPLAIICPTSVHHQNSRDILAPTLYLREGVSSTFNMKSFVLPATALLGSASLAFGRPQFSQLQIGNLPDLPFNLNTDPNSISSPPPAQFNPTVSPPSAQFGPSSFLSFNNVPNLAMGVQETVPPPDAPVDSAGVSTDYFQLITPSGDDPFDIAENPRSIVVTKGANMLIDSVLNREYTYGIFGLSSDLRSVVSVTGGKTPDWYAFGQAVRTAPMGFALHLIDEGMLLIINLRIRNAADRDGAAVEQEKPILVLKDNEKSLLLRVQGKVEKKYGETPAKVTYLIEVYNDRDLENAINTYSHAPKIHFFEQQLSSLSP